jgi:hypothetical protein
MARKPKAPKETPLDKYLRSRQLVDLDKLDIQENAQKKAISRGRLGSRMLLSGSALGIVDEGVAQASVAGTRAASPAALTRRQQRIAAQANRADRGAGGGRTWPGGGGGTEVP